MPARESERPRVSVIVPVRNGRRDLEALVEALGRQTLATDEFELVVADDGSTDGSTRDLPQPNGLRVRVTAGRPENSYAARNRAVRESSAPALAFCDADCVPEPEWLEHGLRALERDDIVAGRIRYRLPERRTVWTLLDMDSYKDHERQVQNGTAETANLFLTRATFDEIGGFDSVIPESGDFDFVQRACAAGLSLSFAADAVVWHPTRNRWRPYLRAQWIYCRGYAMRLGAAGRFPADLRPRALFPFIPVVRTRRWWGRSLGPDRRWLGENGVVPTTTEVVKALPLMYIVIPYLRAAAQLVGWLEGRRTRAERDYRRDPRPARR